MPEPAWILGLFRKSLTGLELRRLARGYFAITGAIGMVVASIMTVRTKETLTKGEDMTITMTPWGEPNWVHDIGNGILRIDTDSHGGYWVPDDLLPMIAPGWRNMAAKWSHGMGDHWYEEDVCWAGVAMAFPSLFPASAVKFALELSWRYASLCGVTQSTGPVPGNAA